jgi:hypothetical protein
MRLPSTLRFFLHVGDPSLLFQDLFQLTTSAEDILCHSNIGKPGGKRCDISHMKLASVTQLSAMGPVEQQAGVLR